MSAIEILCDLTTDSSLSLDPFILTSPVADFSFICEMTGLTNTE